MSNIANRNANQINWAISTETSLLFNYSNIEGSITMAQSMIYYRQQRGCRMRVLWRYLYILRERGHQWSKFNACGQIQVNRRYYHFIQVSSTFAQREKKPSNELKYFSKIFVWNRTLSGLATRPLALHRLRRHPRFPCCLLAHLWTCWPLPC